MNDSGKGGRSDVVDEVVVVGTLGGEETVESGGSRRKLIVVGDIGDSRSDGDRGSISRSSSRLGLGLSSSRFGRSKIESSC